MMQPPPPPASAEVGANSSDDTRRVKELLYRVEAERLQLQQTASHLTQNKQQLTADVLSLRQQLADAHAAIADSQQQNTQLSSARDRLQVQVKAATAEYRANDIIAVGLRDQITALQRELRDSQHVCSQQAAEIATFADDMAALRTCKADMTQQLSDLQRQHQQLGEQHASTVQQLSRAQQEAQDIQRRWVDEHGGQVQALQAVQEARQQAEQQAAEVATQLEQEQQRLAQQQSRCAELECELVRIRELAVLLGKAVGRQPGGTQLPGHDDPVWQQLGPLGGVTFALDTAIKHTREQHVRVKELQAEADALQDGVRAESAQKADLQSELFETRTLYAKAVAVREVLEARTARAEAEKAAADSSWLQAQTQAKEDGSRISSLQEQVMSLTQQVQVLQPLQPKLSTAEVERDTALHKLERLQEQCDQLQRQLQHATSREAGLQADVDAYKLEHTQLLAANAQLMAQCTGLNKDLQALEVEVREGSLAKGQLEEARVKLGRTKTQLQAMTERHVDTLTRLENTKDLLASPSASASSRPTSAWSRGSRPGTAGTRLSGLPAGGPSTSIGSSPRASPRGSGVGAAVQLAGTAAAAIGYGVCSSSTPQAVVAGVSTSAASGLDGAAGAATSDASASNQPSVPAAYNGNVGRGGGADAGVDDDDDGAAMQRSTSEEDHLDRLLRQRELERLVDDQHTELDELRQQVQQQQVQVAQLEVQLLRQEAEHLQQQRAGEAGVGEQCLAAAGEAVEGLRAALCDLQQALQGPAAEVAGQACSEGLHQQQAPQQQSQDMQQQQQQRWLQQVAAQMVSTMQGVVDQAQARAALVAARCSVGVQSDEAQQAQWLRFIRALPDGVVAQPLHIKAASEAILRLYMRGLGQLEQQQQAHTQRLQQQLLSGSGGGGAVSVVTVFDLLMAHYTPSAAQQSSQSGGRGLSVQPYSAALWKDPQGPITRLLLSCRSLAPTSIKVALFCCLAGTHTPVPACSSSVTQTWGLQHWQQFLLLLHAAKLLTGGLWKGLLRDWAAASGAVLPLQCVLDLLGNVYNVSSLSGLDQQPAVLGSRQALLRAVAGGQQEEVVAVAGAVLPGAGSSSSNGSRAATASRASLPSPQQQQQPHGSVSAALGELVVDGPLGPASAVDFDDLLAMLMMQHNAGLLPPHPLLQPRRLTTGDLGNTTNAWGSAATEASSSAAGSGSGLMQLQQQQYQYQQPPDSPGALSTASGGWLSRPTTGVAASANSRIGTAAAAAAASPAGMLTLPRLRTPDSAVAVAKDTGSLRGSSSCGGSGGGAGSLPSQGGGSAHGVIRKGISMGRTVAFKEP